MANRASTQADALCLFPVSSAARRRAPPESLRSFLVSPESCLDFLFIENVGNLVCPATFDLGEDLRLVLFSVTEGEDKPLKYPTIFNTSDVAVITKIDIASAVEFDRIAAHRSIQSVRPGMPIWEISAKTGEGMDAWLGFLESRLTDSRQERQATAMHTFNISLKYL